jgi:hypothetical protein
MIPTLSFSTIKYWRLHILKLLGSQKNVLPTTMLRGNSRGFTPEGEEMRSTTEKKFHASSALNTPLSWKDWEETSYKDTRDRMDMAIAKLEKISVGPGKYDVLRQSDDEESHNEEEDTEETREEGREDEDEGEWQKVVGKPKGLPVPKHSYNDAQCHYFSLLYNAYFKALTGKDLDFVITPSSQPFVSAFEACIERDQLLSTLFNERPVIVDPMGGSGSDTCAMLFNLYPKTIITCEWIYSMSIKLRQTEYSILERNINNMISLFHELRGEDAPVVRCENMDCKDFLESLAVGFLIDILYLDPNWATEGSKVERTPKQMIEYLREKVIEPLNGKKISPKCIVYKTRWGHETLWDFMKELTPDYHVMYSVEATPFRDRVDEVKFRETGEVHGRFHWVVIVRNELKTVHWQRSQMYMDVFRNGKNVVVAKADLIRPHIPLYANNILRHKKRIHSDDEETITVVAPRRPNFKRRSSQGKTKR